MTEPSTEDGQYIEYVRLDDLAGAERNSRNGHHDLDGIGRSVEALGFTTEPKVDERTGQLVRGHGRVAWLRRLRDRGAEVPEGIRDVGDDWAVPVVRGWSSRDDLHALATAEADNRVGAKSGTDPEVHLDILAELAADRPDYLRGAGYDSEYLDELVAQVGAIHDELAAGATVTDLDGLGSALAPWDRPGADPFGDRPTPPERRDDEQWGSGMVEPEYRAPAKPREEPDDAPEELPDRAEPETPGPLDVAPAWRTLQPWRAIFHDGTPEGRRKVVEWCEQAGLKLIDPVDYCADDVRDVVIDRPGHHPEIISPGRWATRDGQTGLLELWAPAEFYDRFVPANEPARRVQRAASTATVPAPPGGTA